MRLEAVVTCVGYADFLAWSIALNRIHFDQIIVVTSTDDERTSRVCETYNIRCLKTNICKVGEPFDKGKLINLGLTELKTNDYVCNIDADIILPARFREMLGVAQIQPDSIYGCSRMNAVGFKNWVEYFTNPRPQIHQQIYLFNDIFPMSPTINKLWNNHEFKFEYETGFCVLGFLQIWNQGFKKRTYPEGHADAGMSDLEFSLQWPRLKRVLIPEINVFHLCSTDGVKQGQNWKGRKSAPFDLSELEGKNDKPSS